MSASALESSLRTRLAGLHGRGIDAVDVAEESVAVATDLQRLALHLTRRGEARTHARLARLADDPEGKAFITAMTDQFARAHDPRRVADQVAFLIDRYPLPRYMSRRERAQLRAFRWLGPALPRLLVPLLAARIRRETRQLVLPGGEPRLARQLGRRFREGVRINLNRLGEAILGEGEAETRLERYLEAIALPEVECVSVKVSSIGSQLELLAWEDVLDILGARLRQLLRVAQQTPHRRADGGAVPKLVYLDMEEHADLELTVELFRRVLDEPEFHGAAAGIALQAYLPDSWAVQQALVAWARARVAQGGAPVRIRLVKGANLAMERCEAAVQSWPQAPFTSKAAVDASFKRMAEYSLRRENAAAARVGIASHNVFDIAFGLVIRSLAGSEEWAGFEMLEGMAEPLRRAVQAVAGDVLVYCPAVPRTEFQSAIAYLMRRFDEHSARENFLRVSFALHPGSEAWQTEEARFRAACARRDDDASRSRRDQDRRTPPRRRPRETPSAHEPDTDFSLAHNREWIAAIAERWRTLPTQDVPCQVAGEEIFPAAGGFLAGSDPSQPGRVLSRSALADEALAERAVAAALEAACAWGERSLEERAGVLAECAHGLREARGELIGVMMADGGKAIREADAEVSEAVDFAEYYRRSLRGFVAHPDLELVPRGVVLVTPPWNFPLAIPAGGVLAALIAGNAVILKPAPETALTAWKLASVLWQAGVPREVLQFLSCPDERVGSRLVADERIAAIVLTGATATARLFQRLRPRGRLFAETGGKNSLIVTALADRDLAIHHAVRSAFSHAGQKCSAASLLVCEAEVYDDPGFRERLVDAARSLPVGPVWDPRAVVTPLIRPPEGALARALTSLEEGEEWLLAPHVAAENPALWSPGIKLGVAERSFMHQTELFGPVLAMLRADDLEHALALANRTPYGLTAGLCSLDEREQQRWSQAIDVGNAYLNRGTTGAIVERQPFGGRKASSFGPGAKAGGPNYALQLMEVHQRRVPEGGTDPDPGVAPALATLERALDEDTDRAALRAAARSYAAHWQEHFTREHDPARLLGQDNRFRYRPLARMLLRLGRGAAPLAVAQALAAGRTCGLTLPLSADGNDAEAQRLLAALADWPQVHESESALGARLATEGVQRLRVIGEIGEGLLAAAHAAGVHCEAAPVLANGRVELLRYLQEQVICVDYHRHGNLGTREGETRTPIL